MSFTDPQTVQNPTTGLVAPFGWGDAVNGTLNFLRGAKAGCRLTSLVGTATGTDTPLPWGTETYDVNGCHSTASLTERIVVPSGWAGLWAVGTTIRGSANPFTIYIVVNATTRVTAASSNASGAVVSTVGCETIYPMAVADYFEVWMTGGTSRDTGVASSFWAHWLASGT